MRKNGGLAIFRVLWSKSGRKTSWKKSVLGEKLGLCRIFLFLEQFFQKSKRMRKCVVGMNGHWWSLRIHREHKNLRDVKLRGNNAEIVEVF